MPIFEVGKYAAEVMIDEQDVERFLQYSWHICIQTTNIYCVRREKVKVNGEWRRRKIYLHRWLVGETDPQVLVDHRDRNGLNCTRNNLRRSNTQQNTNNSRKRLNVGCRYRGVSKVKNRFRAQIRENGKTKCLGYYDNEVDAALAYDKAHIRIAGEFANPNFPQEEAA